MLNHRGLTPGSWGTINVGLSRSKPGAGHYAVLMELNWVEVSADPSVAPFEYFTEVEGYQFPDMWRLYDVPEDESYWLFTDSSGEEVARLHLDERPGLSEAGYDPGVDDDLTVQIVFLDVRESSRGRGLGRWIAAWVCSGFPDRRVVALAKEEAEGFWRSIGWEESRAEQGPEKSVMFASPMKASATADPQ